MAYCFHQEFEAQENFNSCKEISIFKVPTMCKVQVAVTASDTQINGPSFQGNGLWGVVKVGKGR